jgi:hypothetical protein
VCLTRKLLSLLHQLRPLTPCPTRSILIFIQYKLGVKDFQEQHEHFSTRSRKLVVDVEDFCTVSLRFRTRVSKYSWSRTRMLTVYSLCIPPITRNHHKCCPRTSQWHLGTALAALSRSSDRSPSTLCNHSERDIISDLFIQLWSVPARRMESSIHVFWKWGLWRRYKLE